MSGTDESRSKNLSIKIGREWVNNKDKPETTALSRGFYLNIVSVLQLYFIESLTFSET